jgi:hypothetical protein
MIKKSKLHHSADYAPSPPLATSARDSRNTKRGIKGVGLASDLRVLRVFVVKISSVNSVSLW